MNNLHFFQNNLSGDIPESFAGLVNLTHFFVEKNNFTSVPDFSDHPNASVLTVRAQLNYLNFGDIEANHIGAPLKEFTYLTQKNDQTPVIEDFYVGAEKVIVNDRAGGDNTTYQWETWNGAEWQIVEGASEKDLIIPAAGLEHNGIAYRCKMTNSVVTDLVIYSTNVVLKAVVSLDYYAVADGDWTNPLIWSRTLGGESANEVPTIYDRVYLDGHLVKVDGEASCREVNIEAAKPGKLLVSGKDAHLIVKGEVKIEGSANKGIKMLVVDKGGKIECIK